MEFGYNTDVAFGADDYHVQTEGKFGQNPRIDTLVYKSGSVLHKLSRSQPGLSAAPQHRESTQKLIKKQHLRVVSLIRKGEFDRLAYEVSHPSEMGLDRHPAAARSTPAAVATAAGPELAMPSADATMVLKRPHIPRRQLPPSAAVPEPVVSASTDSFLEDIAPAPTETAPAPYAPREPEPEPPPAPMEPPPLETESLPSPYSTLEIPSAKPSPYATLQVPAVEAPAQPAVTVNVDEYFAPPETAEEQVVEESLEESVEVEATVVADGGPDVPPDQVVPAEASAPSMDFALPDDEPTVFAMEIPAPDSSPQPMEEELPQSADERTVLAVESLAQGSLPPIAEAMVELADERTVRAGSAEEVDQAEPSEETIRAAPREEAIPLASDEASADAATVESSSLGSFLDTLPGKAPELVAMAAESHSAPLSEELPLDLLEEKEERTVLAPTAVALPPQAAPLPQAPATPRAAAPPPVKRPEARPPAPLVTPRAKPKGKGLVIALASGAAILLLAILIGLATVMLRRGEEQGGNQSPSPHGESTETPSTPPPVTGESPTPEATATQSAAADSERVVREATVTAASGDVDRALGMLEGALSAAPGDVALLHGKGEVLRRMGRTEEALMAYRKGSESPDATAAIVYRYGEAALAVGKTDEASKAMEKLLNVEGSDASVLRPLLAGRLSDARGNVEEAAASIRQAIGNAPKDARGYQAMGDILLSLGTKNHLPTFLLNARDQYQKAAERAPDDPDIEVALGKLLLASKDVPEAKAKIEAAVARYQASYEGQLLLGAAELRLGAPDRALDHLQKAGKLAPSRSEAQLLSGTAAYQLGKHAAAVEYFLQALQSMGKPQLQPYPDVHKSKDELRAMIGDSIKKAIQEDPDNRNALRLQDIVVNL